MPKNNAIIFLSFTLILHNSSLLACTGIFLKTTSDNRVYARTLEFMQDLQSQILVTPRNYHCIAITPTQNQHGLAWSAKYAVVGANAFNSNNFVDGVNETGLAGGLFYFPGFAGYQDVTEHNCQQSLPMWQLLTWILTSCATVAEVKQELPKLTVSKATFPGQTDVLPLHLIVHDPQGNSLVIEYINGTLFMHDNPLGVMTNSPNFEWHITNVRNYINLTPVSAANKTIAGVTFSPLGQGSGMLGLPGDFTPPSRFIRATAFSQAAPGAPTEIAAIRQAFHILNNFDIPHGSAIDAQGNSDYTLWTSAIDMKNKIFYFRTHDQFQLHSIHLMKMHLDAAQPVVFAMESPDQIIDLPS